jgi:hypothetical protein
MERNNELVTVDAASVLDQVSSRIRQEALLPEPGAAVRMHSGRVHYQWNTLTPSSVAAPDEDLTQLALRLRNLQSGLHFRIEAAIRNLGAAPPSAGSLRGRIGAAAILLLQRLLWWQTRSLHNFGDVLAAQHQAELELLKSIVLAQAEMRQEIDALRTEVDRMRTSC